MSYREKSVQGFSFSIRSVRRSKGEKKEENEVRGFINTRSYVEALPPVGCSCKKTTPHLGWPHSWTAGIPAAAAALQEARSLCSRWHFRSLETWIPLPWQYCCRARALEHHSAKAAVTSAQEPRSDPLPATTLMTPEAKRTKSWCFSSSFFLVSCQCLLLTEPN